MFNQPSLFPCYNYRIENGDNKPYKYNVFLDQELKCRFMGLDTACAYIRHCLAGGLMGYKQRCLIVDNVLADFRANDDRVKGTHDL